MRHCKSGSWWENNVQRALANNSAVYNSKPDIGQFMEEWLSLYRSGSGERGLFNRYVAKKYVSELPNRDSNHKFGVNPCCVTGDSPILTDKEYLHDKLVTEEGVTLHFLYKNNPKIIENWKKAQGYTAEILKFFNAMVGKYPYEQYSVIQGGDGGMEYAMCTLVLGEGELNGFIGLIAHEFGHSWFQQVLAINESKHGWMDEGFTSFIEDTVMNHFAEKKAANPYAGAYKSYFDLVKSGKEQPLSTHADRFDLNRSYSVSSYSKGELFLSQLIYLIGEDNLMKTLRRFYDEFKFKHPTPNDIKRTAERISGAHLDWFLTDWTQTTNTIDYGISEVVASETAQTKITLERIGRMPMPIDLLVEYTDGSKESIS